MICMSPSRRREEKWVVRGFLSACECFSCANKLDHRLKGERVYILCRDPCHYVPLKGEVAPRIEDIEAVKTIP